MTQTLKFTRTPSGIYHAEVEGSMTEFETLIQNEGTQEWRVNVFTHGRLLTSKKVKTLREAKAEAQQTFDVVESAAQGV